VATTKVAGAPSGSEVFEVVFLWVSHEGSETELRLGFFCNTSCVLLSGNGLQDVEDHQSLVLNDSRSDEREITVALGFLLLTSVTFATTLLGSPDPYPSFVGVVGTVKGFELW
jgi:hypothetical protein